ncbi:chromate efflux transporter [Novispirillum itersonii]|uniref:Chromate transporter n=1 Tax=Novispirillum itersonii TaxID=189 RepID=A0A7X0DN10_NOVIT|nr:chromate efflux transporter [Novispirillum itersonii]MBB6209747.1 chromate transporter [Novispirillum itersonii]
MTDHPVSLSAAIRVWTRIALLSFGGPAGQIALMHRELVEDRRWISEQRFLHALNYCMLLPGPEAQQLATYIGWLMHGLKGGLIAGGLFILPGLIAILGLSWVYVLFGQVPMIEGMFFGLKTAVLALVLQAMIRLSGRALKTGFLRLIALAAFLALTLFQSPFPVVVLAALLLGVLSGWRQGHSAAPAVSTPSGSGTLLGETLPPHAQVSVGWSLRVGGVFLCLWLLPVAALSVLLPGSTYQHIAVFFSKMAVVSFGGAYAVLTYVAQQAVEGYGWLSTAEMVDGLGLAETTPGPLIMVVQFVGFLGGYRDPGALPPLLGGSLAALLTTWVTFAPCFLWIFLGAPFVETLRHNRALATGLTTLTAAVVGVIGTLALWFGLHVLFATVTTVTLGPVEVSVPELISLQPVALGLTVLAFMLLRRGPVTTLTVCAASGAVLHHLLP